MKPENVRVQRANGDEIACELIHEGTDDNGMDCWRIAGVEFHPEYGDCIKVGVFPPSTSISVSGGFW